MTINPSDLVVIRGGGDLASGVALRLHHAGFSVLITELHQPLSVRRAVSFSEAVYEETWKVEDVTAQLADTESQAADIIKKGNIAVLIAPELDALKQPYSTLIDARLLKTFIPYPLSASPLILGLGPGFRAGENCHAAIETQRGHTLGRVYWTGETLPDSGQPDGDPRRVLRAPVDGYLTGSVQIGEQVKAGQTVAQIGREKVTAPFDGVVRGLIRSGLRVSAGLKIGDIDPRNEPAYCYTVSDKALAIGGSALEAILQYQKRSAQ